MLHRQGGGCPKCGHDKKRKPKIKINNVKKLREQRSKEFFEIVNKKFGTKFDLSKLIFTKNKNTITKSKMIKSKFCFLVNGMR